MDLAQRGPMGPKPAKSKPDPDHMARVGSLPCCICEGFGMIQATRTEVHHVIHDRYSRKRSPDRETIPLCNGHHKGDLEIGKIAIHRNPNKWREQYGSDRDWIAPTLDKLGE